jgi:hypothetical protein
VSSKAGAIHGEPKARPFERQVRFDDTLPLTSAD